MAKHLMFWLLVAGVLVGCADSPAADRRSDDKPAKLHPDQQMVLDWIKENADDPNIEIVRWYAPVLGTESDDHYVRLKYRAEGRSGRRLHDDVWRISGKKIIKYESRWARAMIARWDKLKPVR